jgi:hypothetical protein
MRLLVNAQHRVTDMEKDNDHPLIRFRISSPPRVVELSPQLPPTVVKISRQGAIDKIITNLLASGVISPSEQAMYRSVIQSYDDLKLQDTLEYTDQLRIPPHAV